MHYPVQSILLLLLVSVVGIDAIITVQEMCEDCCKYTIDEYKQAGCVKKEKIEIESQDKRSMLFECRPA